MGEKLKITQNTLLKKGLRESNYHFRFDIKQSCIVRIVNLRFLGAKKIVGKWSRKINKVASDFEGLLTKAIRTLFSVPIPVKIIEDVGSLSRLDAFSTRKLVFVIFFRGFFNVFLQFFVN